MARYVVEVPDPAVGTDWRYTIPGQYVEQIAAVSATLTTGTIDRTATLTVTDGTNTVGAYGSGFPAGGTAGAPGFLLSADSFDRANNAASLGSTDGGGSTDPQAWTSRLGTLGILSHRAYGANVPTGGRSTLNLGTGDVDLSFTKVGTAVTGFGIILRYLDNNNFIQMLGDSTQCVLAKTVAGVPTGIFPNFGTVTDGTVMRLIASGSTLTVMLNGVVKRTGTDGFQAAQQLHGIAIDGTNDKGDTWIARVPGGATAYTWSWVTTLAANAQTVNGSTVTVGIPDLILPAGYTIGTTTPDLAAGDQWSNITIWFDDVSSGQLGGWQPPPYLNALLVPQWWPNRPQ